MLELHDSKQKEWSVPPENGACMELELELEFYLFDRQLHNIGEIISKKNL